jgi:hypothetical protein
MSFRIFAAGIVVLGFGAMIAPIETAARSGGFTAAPSLGTRGAARPSVATPFFSHPFRPERFSGAFSKPQNGLSMSREAERRGFGFPLWWDYASYPPSYYPTEYSAPYGEFPYPYPPTEEFSERSRPIVTYRPGCRTDTQKVPSETGGERSINITRCY